MEPTAPLRNEDSLTAPYIGAGLALSIVAYDYQVCCYISPLSQVAVTPWLFPCLSPMLRCQMSFCCRQQAGGVSVDENSMQLSGYILQQEVRFHSRLMRCISCSFFHNWIIILLGMWIHNFFPNFTYQLLLTIHILVCRVILQLKVKQ
jgi:hypothetical protein